MSRTAFHRLTVRRVDRLTADAVAVTFDVPDELSDTFAFRAGQFLTVRHRGERRSYSICAEVGQPPRIGVRALTAGTVSRWLTGEIGVGDVIDVQAPSGSFTPDVGRPGRHVLLAAGAGITPILSIAGSVLAGHPDAGVTVIYGNRRANTVMFADELAELKDGYPSRMRVIHVLSRERQEAELLNGRLDGRHLRRLLPAMVDLDRTEDWWVCGPHGMVEAALTVLAELGVPGQRVHTELFYVEPEPPSPDQHLEERARTGGARLTLRLDGRDSILTIPAGTTVLDGAQPTRPELPFACKGGVCGTCRAMVVDGTVRMRRNYALEQAEVDAGYVLTCQAVPVSASVSLDYDR